MTTTSGGQVVPPNQDLISRMRPLVIPGEQPTAAQLKRAGDLTQAPAQTLRTLANFGDKLAENELKRRLIQSGGMAALVPPVVAATNPATVKAVNNEFDRVGAGRPATLTPSQASTIQTAIRGPRYKSLATDEQREYLQTLLKKSQLRLPGGQ